MFLLPSQLQQITRTRDVKTSLITQVLTIFSCKNDKSKAQQFQILRNFGGSNKGNLKGSWHKEQPFTNCNSKERLTLEDAALSLYFAEFDLLAAVVALDEISFLLS